MKKNVIPPAHEPTEAEIAHTAYLLWLESGRAPGRDLDNWLAARELLRHRAPADRHRVVPPIPPPIPAEEPAEEEAARAGTVPATAAPILAL